MKKHWTVRYIFNRVKNYYFEKNNQDLPWLTPKSIKLLKNLFKKTDVGVEFGSGRSTVWFAKRCKFLTGIEDDYGWYEIVSKKINEQNIKNVNYYYKKSNSVNEIESEYSRVIQGFKDNNLDFVLIDGEHRGIISLDAMEKIKTGGLLILDNANRYLPFNTHSPHSIGNDINKIKKEWVLFLKRINSWRMIWTSNGITDTVIYIKP